MKRPAPVPASGEGGGFPPPPSSTSSSSPTPAAVVIRPAMPGNAVAPGRESLPASEPSRRVGFNAEEALLPYDATRLPGLPPADEYFACPQRFLFVQTGELARRRLSRGRARAWTSSSPSRRRCPELEVPWTPACFAPALHARGQPLSPSGPDRIFVTDRASEFQVIPDRTRPLDFEVYKVTRRHRLLGREQRGDGVPPLLRRERGRRLLPAYYATNRVPRAVSERERSGGALQLRRERGVRLAGGRRQRPYSSDLNQLAVETPCTNRDLPCRCPSAKARPTSPWRSAPRRERARHRRRPPRPPQPRRGRDVLAAHQPPQAQLPLPDGRGPRRRRGGDAVRAPGARRARDLLRLYGDASDPRPASRSRASRPSTRSPSRGACPRGGGAIGLRTRPGGQRSSSTRACSRARACSCWSAVLEQFFARYVSMNSFTETVVKSVERGEIMRWTARSDSRPVL